VDHCRRCYSATMISGGADALTNPLGWHRRFRHRGGASVPRFGPGGRVCRGARHPDPAPPHGWRIRNDWRMITP
jgi:hypothetical protein